MGVDIKMFAENRRDGGWELAPNGEFGVFYHERHRHLFQILEDGKWRDPILLPLGRPAFEPNLPRDVCKDIREWADDVCGDPDSFFGCHHIMLRALLEYDWELYSRVIPGEGHPFNEGNTFVRETIPRLKELGSPDDVRIVYWFDR